MIKTVKIVMLVMLLTHIPVGLWSQDHFIGEVRLFAIDFAPKGWAECNGQLISIQSNTALFSLLGTTFGGDGKTTFGLPNLNGRTPVHPHSAMGISSGNAGGTEFEQMTMAQMPAHTHTISAITAMQCANVIAGISTPGFYAMVATRGNAFSTSSNAQSAAMPLSLSATGGTTPRDNRQPYITMAWYISTSGIFPNRY
jgi:microcystin-dependent protein